MHIHLIEEDGQTVDLIPFCCDSCHQQWCADNNVKYDGWFGCQEGGDSQQFCASCGVYCGGGTGEDAPCPCQINAIVVNRFHSDDGVKCQCEKKRWIQLPASYLDSMKV